MYATVHRYEGIDKVRSEETTRNEETTRKVATRTRSRRWTGTSGQ